MATTTTPKTLNDVRRAASRRASAESTLRDAVMTAHAQGESLRAIAAAAGMSHEQVRRIVSR